MSTASPLTASTGRRSRPVEEKFAAVNRERLRAIRAALTPRQRDFLELLPLLFHTNHPLLPGYVSQATPTGIRDYSPEKETLAAAHRLTKSFSYDPRGLRTLDILGLYLMGSVGTIAYSPKSDFDIWLCHTPGLGEAAVAELREKGTRIEAAATAMGLDVHFFVFDPDSFRHGDTTTLSAESSGSSQHYLLLDEFYRSSVVIAGLYPIWWKVPPAEEQNYDTYVAELVRRRFVGNRDFIDFGGLARIPAEEFFGAAVWQLYKSINSPYKSVLKLLLIEAYADEYPDIDLLALRYKTAVYAGVTNMNDLDPYLLMYDKVEEYLMARQETARLNVLRRSFYLKINEKLSQPPSHSNSEWRRETLGGLTRKWGWELAQLALMDTQEHWKLPTVLDERRELIAALTHSYRMLSQFARRQSENPRITRTDLHVLGRKLYAAFERKAGKVEIVNRGIAPNLLEKCVSLHLLRGADGQESWLLFADTLGAEEIGDRTPLKRCPGIVEMLTWCHFNGIIDGQTHISIHAPSTGPSVRELRMALEALESLFPGGRHPEARIDDLTRPPRLRRAGLFVNAGIDPMAAKSRSGDLIASNRTDALSYGGLHENLAISFDLVFATSWEEVFTFRYQDPGGLMDCLCEYLRARPDSREPPLTAFCFSPAYGATISARLQNLFDDVGDCFRHGRPGAALRYVVEAADTFHVIARDDDGPGHLTVGSYHPLIAFLSKPCARYTETVFDRNTLPGRMLPTIYRCNRPGAIQVFFKPAGRKADVYVLDERGSLFTQKMDFYNQHALIDHLHRFLHTMLNRAGLLLARDRRAAPEIAIEFRALGGDDRSGHRVEPVAYDADRAQHYLQIKVLVETGKDGRTRYTILCDDREFTSLEHGAEVFAAAARHVLRMRRGGEHYPIYITDLDLSRARTPDQHHLEGQTVQVLQYKKLIEDRFLNVLRAK